ncbi:MAG: hypothetical protein ACKO4A_02580, partial [Gammaproteobacteria bacterium]
MVVSLWLSDRNGESPVAGCCREQINRARLGCQSAGRVDLAPWQGIRRVEAPEQCRGLAKSG